MKTSIEDYIKHIYTLQDSGRRVGTAVLAQKMDITMPSVSEMVKKLTAAGYLRNKPYHGFLLTGEGEKIAVSLIRKHRLLEYFLLKVLNFEWDEIHQEAETLEHFVSDKFIERLESVLDFPKFDPHGHPIPDGKGRIPNAKSLVLSDAVIGRNYLVSSVDDKSREILKYLKGIGIKIGSGFRIHDLLEVDKSVIIKIGRKRYLLSKTISDSIRVTAK